MTFDELIVAVEKWGEDRGIFEPGQSSAIKQLDKTSEEFNELQRAAGMRVAADYAAETYSSNLLTAIANEDLEDAYGDVLVTLIMAARLHGVGLTKALHGAYNIIKERKGRMVNGKFVKEEDL